MSEAVYPVPEGFKARIGPRELAELNDLASGRPRPLLARPGAAADLEPIPDQGRRLVVRRSRFPHPMVCGRRAQPVGQLPRPPPRRAWRQGRADLRGRRARRTAAPITYRELYEETCRFANLLKQRGIGRGDRVMIYMPMIPEAAAAMLACARIGAIHSVVFGGFSPESLAGRIADCGACCRHHRRRGRARRQDTSRSSATSTTALEQRDVADGHRRHPHRRRRADEGRPRHLLLGGPRRPRHRLRAGES